MLKTIHPQYQCFYGQLVDRFIENLEILSGDKYPAYEKNNATFILGHDKESGFCGGALLSQKDHSHFPPEMMRVLADFVPYKEKIWNCTIGLSFEEKSSIYKTGDVELFCQTFYRKLYEKLLEFGKNVKTGFLCVSLDSSEYFCIEGALFWPFVFELKPQSLSGQPFHGILPLKGSQPEAYQKAWEALDRSAQERKVIV